MELVQRQYRHIQNVGQPERIASVIAGTALSYYGIRKSLADRSWPGAALALAGAALIKRGITGYCDLYRSIGVSTTGQQESSNAAISYQQGIRIDRSVTINVSREHAYAFWRNLENLPRFMTHVHRIKKIDDRRSHWVVDGPLGKQFEWDAEIINEIPNELLAWRSLPGASVNNAGSVRFDHATAGRGTKISVSLQYDAPGGPAGAMIAKLSGREPEQEVESELRHLKNILEAGEIPTNEGQSTGRPDQNADQLKKHAKKQMEDVHHASEESFPASDAPAYTH